MSRPLDSDLTRPTVLVTGPLPPRMEVNEGLLREVDPGGTAQIVESKRYLVNLGTNLAEEMTKPDGRKKALESFGQLLRAMRFYLTHGGPVPEVDLPQSSAQVLPAVAAVEKVFPIIREEARFAVRNLPLDDLRDLSALVNELTDLRAANKALADDVDGLIALCLDHLREIVRVFDYKTAALIDDDSEVATLLGPLDILLRGAARRAVQTRKAGKNSGRVAGRVDATGAAKPAAGENPAAGETGPKATGTPGRTKKDE